MKARLFVVNEETIARVLTYMEVSVMVPEPKGKKSWNETLVDIVSDLMQVEIGDYIFLWESGSKKIYGVYRAISHPFYQADEGRNDIFRIKIDIAYKFEKPIREYDIINNPYMKSKLWNIIGKKVAGKSRGTSPLTLEEMQFLIQSLIDANEEYIYHNDYTIVDVDNEVLFDMKNDFESMILNRLQEYEYHPLKIKKGSGVQYEKALEGVLNYLFREQRQDIIGSLGIDCKNVVWFANYLPYGLERAEMDYMVMESLDGVTINRIDVIELMINIIDVDHINRCLQYAKWVAESVTNNKNIVRPILICSNKSMSSGKGFINAEIAQAIADLPKSYGFKGIDIYTYSMGEEISFTKYEGNLNE